MRRTVDFIGIVGLLLVMAACGSSATMTTSTQATPPQVTRPPVVVEVHSYATGMTDRVLIEANEPQLPMCLGRDLVISRHVHQGGLKNDIKILSDGHRVFLQDNGPGLDEYEVWDYPTPWCTDKAGKIIGKSLAL